MIPVSPHRFAAALGVACRTERGAYLTPYSADELQGCLCLLDNSMRAGGAIRPAKDGTPEAVALFNIGAVRGTGRRILNALRAQGARRLDCLGDGLRTAYERAGWRVVETIAWNDDYAPEGWNYQRDGRPNVYVMIPA